jgi:flavin-dependent dehydrogenase
LLQLAAISCHTWDAVIIGAGPAGSIAARGLANRGHSVLLVDRAEFPRSKVCGACLNPFALSILSLAGLGDLPGENGALPVEKMRLAVSGRHADVGLPGWKALSRQRFDAALVQAAVQARVTFLPQTHASLGPGLPDGRTARLRRGDEETKVVSRIVLAADGLGSRVLAEDDANTTTVAPSSRVGSGVVADSAPDFYRDGIIYMAYGRAGYVGLVRLEDGRLNIAAALDVQPLRAAHSPGAAVEQLLEEVGWPAAPNLAELPWRGTPTLTRRAARPGAERVFAIGDAAGYVEPFTGEGIGWALASGVAVVPFALRAIENWTSALADEWTADCRRRAAQQQRLCKTMTWLSRHTRIARALVGVVGRAPWLAAPLVRQVQSAPRSPRLCAR